MFCYVSYFIIQLKKQATLQLLINNTQFTELIRTVDEHNSEIEDSLKINGTSALEPALPEQEPSRAVTFL